VIGWYSQTGAPRYSESGLESARGSVNWKFPEQELVIANPLRVGGNFAAMKYFLPTTKW
jgi:hypothetical protein